MSHAHTPTLVTCYSPEHEAARYAAWEAHRPHSVMTPGLKYWTWGCPVNSIKEIDESLAGMDFAGVLPTSFPELPWLPSYSERDLIPVHNGVGHPSTVWFTRDQIEGRA